MHQTIDPALAKSLQTVSIVIPVYQGEQTLAKLLEEIAPLFYEQKTEAGWSYHVTEVLLVDDNGPDRSDETIKALATQYPQVVPVWLSRNYGQHSATLAGMASSRSDWVITMDEDGQQHPADIAALLDTALTHGSQLVYATPKNAPPHGLLRNTLSRIAKVFFVYALGNRSFGSFNSFRLINGEIARSLAAYCGNNVFLDVALSWVVSRVHHTPVLLRPEMGRPSGYSIRSLVRHFMKLVLTSGTRPLRFIMMIGLLSMILAIAITGYALWAKFHLQVPVQGWTSLVIVVSFFSGCILFSLGVISEYLAVALNIAMGRPLYLITSKPTRRNT